MAKFEARVMAESFKMGEGQARAPIRNFLVPQSAQTARVDGRPFFMVTASMSVDAVFILHLTQ